MRADLWERKAAVFAPFSGQGLSAEDVAIRTGTCVATVRNYAKRFGFNFTAETTSNETVDALRELAVQGKTRREAADTLSMSYQMVVRYGIEHSIEFVHASRDIRASERAAVMGSMYKGGKTLEEIGKLFRLTRERVRQLIKKHCGLTGADGGQSTTAQRKRVASKAKKDAASMLKNGCTHDQYMTLVRMQSQTRAHTRQRNSALQRGIEWNIKLWDWWQIWQKSGKWSDRGRGKGKYVMCRFGDIGAYEPSNVYIATCEHNVSFQPNNPYRKGHPDHAEAIASFREKLALRDGTNHRVVTPGRDLPVGVYQGQSGRYRAQVSIHKKLHYLGTFETAEAARSAIDDRLASALERAAA